MGKEGNFPLSIFILVPFLFITWTLIVLPLKGSHSTRNTPSFADMKLEGASTGHQNYFFPSYYFQIIITPC